MTESEKLTRAIERDKKIIKFLFIALITLLASAFSLAIASGFILAQ